MLSKQATREKIEAFKAGTSDDLSGLPEPTAQELRSRRAAEENARKTYQAAEAKRAADNEAIARARYLSAGNTEQDWQRDKDRVLSDEAIGRLRASHGGSLISPAEMLR